MSSYITSEYTKHYTLEQAFIMPEISRAAIESMQDNNEAFTTCECRDEK